MMGRGVGGAVYKWVEGKGRDGSKKITRMFRMSAIVCVLSLEELQRHIDD